MAVLPSVYARWNKVGKKMIPDVSELTPDDLYKLHKFKGAIEKILEAVNARLKSWSDEELAKIGLMHGKPKELLRWTDVLGAVKYLSAQGKVDEAKIWECLDLVMSRVAAVAYPDVEEADAVKMLKSDLQPYYEIKQGEAGLVKLK